MPRWRTQDILHWMEEGGGARIMQVCAFVLAIVVLSVFLAYKRYQGPPNEVVIDQAIVARQVSQGHGFTTQTLYPQVVATLDERSPDWRLRPGDALPDVYYPPLYPLVLSWGFDVANAVTGFIHEHINDQVDSEWIWVVPIPETSADQPAFNADYILMGVNVILFWVAIFFTYMLARELFSQKAALVSAAGLLLSLGIWDSILLLSGAALLLALAAPLFWLWFRLEKALDVRKRGGLPAGAVYAAIIPVLLGLMFLAEYTAGLTALGYVGYLAWRCRGRVLAVHLGVAVVLFALVVTPWIVRNVGITGSPVGLAWQELVLKAGDPTADPVDFRNTLSAEAPEFSLRKILRKGLEGVEDNIKLHLWGAGAYFYAAFFAVGLLYPFRKPEVNRFRWVATFTVLGVLLLQPFFNSGASERIPAVYFTPVIIVLGVGFFMILLESTSGGKLLRQAGIILGVVALCAAPLMRALSEPRLPVSFTFPPYYPTYMAYVKSLLSDRFVGNYGVMADVPAGLAWYSQQPVWAQPREYADFVDILLYQDIGALFLSPDVLDRPYFSELLGTGLDVGAGIKEKRDWGAVYGSLQSNEVPSFFPLQRVHQIHVNIYVLENPLATGF